MKLGEIYINKNNKSLIQIESYASHMGRFLEDENAPIVIFRNLERHADMIGSLPCFNGYGTMEEIEKEYDILVPKEKLNDLNWNELFDSLKSE